MRWRLSGRGWHVAASLRQLLVQVDAAYPVRHPADGTLGNAAHSARLSDHNPDTDGTVRAGDIGEVVENDAFDVAEAIRLSKDPRVKYVIHEGRMYSSYPKGSFAPFTWRPYSGSNAHKTHVHVSVLESNQDDTSPWDIGTGSGTPLPPGDDDMELTKALQRQCNAGGFKGADGQDLDIDGKLGPNTQHALDSLAKAAADGSSGSHKHGYSGTTKAGG